MLVYHGTAIWRMPGLLRALIARKLKKPGCPDGLYVTDTPERASRYANAQASGVVDPDATELREHAAVVAVAVASPLVWSRRSHPASLDVCEADLHSDHDYRVVRVEYAVCSYAKCTCHRDAEDLEALCADQGIDAQRL